MFKSGWDLLGYSLALLVLLWVAKGAAEYLMAWVDLMLDRMVRRAELQLQKYHDALTRAVVHAQRHARFDESTQEWVIRVPCEPLKSQGFVVDLLEWEVRFNEGMTDKERIRQYAPAVRALRDRVDEMNRRTEQRVYSSKR